MRSSRNHLGGGLLHLTTLGSLGLTRADGSAVTDLLRQPKRMAVLVYLAASRPLAAVRRETLRGLLWPEYPERRARRALNQALYGMRAIVGPGVIASRGASDVLINPTGLECDATVFIRAVTHTPAEAMAVYGGDFLPGFSVPQAAEFERWVEATRDRLRFAAADAAATLCASARAAGRVSEAIGWARRRLDLMPIDELALRDLLRVLAEAGDRGQAAETYRAFARELASYLDTAPSRETQDLLRAILQDVDASSARVLRLRSRVTPAPRLPATPMTVGATRGMRRRWWIPLTLTVASLSAFWIARTPWGRALLDRDDAHRATAAALTRVGRFFWNRRTTASLRGAVGYFDRAVLADPGYAPALSGLADATILQTWYGDSTSPTIPETARAAALAAVRWGDDLAESHTSLGGVRAWLDRDWRDAEREYRRAIALDSTYATAHQWYSLGLAAQGRLDDAVREMRAAERHDPVSPSIATDLAMVLFWSGRDSEAIVQVRYALVLDPTYARASAQLWRLYAAAGRADDAMAALECVIGERGVNRGDIALLRRVYARHGWRGALQWWARSLERSVPTPDRAMRIAVLYALLNHGDVALRWLRRARDERSPYLQFAASDPAFRPLRGDPEFEHIVAFR